MSRLVPPPITLQTMEQIINHFVNDKTAWITEIPREYAFYINLPFGGFWFRELVAAVKEAKPAHLEAIYRAWAGRVSLNLLTSTPYFFTFPYPICNTFAVSDARYSGRLFPLPVYIQSTFYFSPVDYPLCNTFAVTDSDFKGRIFTLTIKLATKNYSWHVGYWICGTFNSASEGVSGKLFVLPLRFVAASYFCPISYPLCGTFVCGGEAA